VKRVAGAAATVAAAACAFAGAVVFAVDASAPELVASVHWPALPVGVDDLGPASSGASGAPLPAVFLAFAVAAGVSYRSWSFPCLEEQRVARAEYPWHGRRGLGECSQPAGD